MFLQISATYGLFLRGEMRANPGAIRVGPDYCAALGPATGVKAIRERCKRCLAPLSDKDTISDVDQSAAD